MTEPTPAQPKPAQPHEETAASAPVTTTTGPAPAATGGFDLNHIAFERVGSTPVEEGASGEGIGLRVAPNPAARRAEVTYRLPLPGPVRLAVFDARGREVRTVASGDARAGEHTVQP